MTKDKGEKLACSMITISENATLRTPATMKLILCHYCEQQECQDIIFYLLLIVICSINMISVSVAVLQIENIIYV